MDDRMTQAERRDALAEEQRTRSVREAALNRGCRPTLAERALIECAALEAERDYAMEVCEGATAWFEASNKLRERTELERDEARREAEKWRDLFIYCRGVPTNEVLPWEGAHGWMEVDVPLSVWACDVCGASAAVTAEKEVKRLRKAVFDMVRAGLISRRYARSIVGEEG